MKLKIKNKFQRKIAPHLREDKWTKALLVVRLVRENNIGKIIMILTSFEKAINSLKEAIAEYNKDKSNSFVRDSVIQRFEYTYELSIKMLKRYLEIISSSKSEVDMMSFNDIIRKANIKGMLSGNLEDWRNYRDMRNITSHTYDEEKASQVISVVDGFLYDAEFLLNILKEKCLD